VKLKGEEMKIESTLRWYDTKWRYTIKWTVNGVDNEVEMLREAGEEFLLKLIELQNQPKVINRISYRRNR